jgi:small subunit ribosomal protein S4
MASRRPRWKTMRRFGVNLYGTRSSGLQKRLTQPPGQHGQARRRKASEYATQLREKQKVRFMYGTNERQFRRTFERALRMPGRTGEQMLSLLERRLDNVVYRLGFSPTRPMARQLVSHGHILVNGRRVTIPSYEVKPGDAVALKESSREIPGVVEALTSSPPPPPWLQRLDEEGLVAGLPGPEDFEPHIEPQRIVEYYSR